MSRQLGLNSNEQDIDGSANKDPDKGRETNGSSFVPPTIRELGVLEDFTGGSGSPSGSS